MGGDWRPAGRGQEAARTRRAGTKWKSREAACGTPGRAQKGAPPTPAIDGRPTKTPPRLARRPQIRLSMTPDPPPGGSKRQTHSRRDRRRGGVRARLCLAAAPARKARRVRSAARTDARSLTAPVAGSERPSVAALLSWGRRGGGQPPRKGYGQTEGLVVRGRLSPLLPNLHNALIYRVRADANSRGGLVKDNPAPPVSKRIRDCR